MNFRSNKSFILVLTAIFILAALGLAFIHHHEEDGHGEHESHQCQVCHFVKTIVFAFFAFLILAFSRIESKYFVSPKEIFFSRFFPKSLLARAPPTA